LVGVRRAKNSRLVGGACTTGRRYLAFPGTPHRGFEIITFLTQGTIDHSDSVGATGRYGAGDVQWLTAGRGIEHAELYPLLDEQGPNTIELFQIWLNVPASEKMVEPYYTMLWRENVPRTVLKDDGGRSTEVAVVAGRLGDLQPPPAPPDSWASHDEADVAIWQFLAEASATWTLPPTASPKTVRTLYVYEGSVELGGEAFVGPIGLVLQSDRPIRVTAGESGAAALILQGRPIGEPVVMGGAFVMNDQREIEEAQRDYRDGGFGRWVWGDDAPVHPRSTGRFATHPDGSSEFPEIV
jgi:redox-sensitive bicupin YhaK (pirin superfamily)